MASKSSLGSSARAAIDWSKVKATTLRLAVAAGLAARRGADVPPLFPGLRIPNVTDAIAERIADRVTSSEEEDREPAPPPRPAITIVEVKPPDPLDIGRAAARLALLAVATVAGLGAIMVFGLILSRPAVSNATQLVDVELQIPKRASLPELEERSTIYDGDGNLLAVIDREVSRKTVPLARIPKQVQHAMIAAEDRKFYEHHGYDLEGIGRALAANLKAGDITEGGSTITQQLAKSEVGTERTLERKARELFYAMALEKKFTKDELLERYLNQVYFGSRAYGIAAAAEEFFHKEPQKLTVVEGALLASLVRSPNSADPRDKKGLAMRRRNAVLEAMAEEGYIDATRVPQLTAKPLGVKESSPRRERRVPHVIDAVRREILETTALGKTKEARERLFYYGGLRITTTLDLEMQRLASNTIRDFLPEGAPTAAIATVDPATGEVKAIASGLGYTDLEYDLPTQGRRQPGSAFKPFVYAAALQDGFPLDIRLTGHSPAYFEGIPGWERDCDTDDKEICGVSNYDGSSYGDLDMPNALQNSVNTAAAQLTVMEGPDRIAKLAGQMNIDIEAATNGQHTNSIGLGGLDQGVTALEMAAAYATFANDGKQIPPHLIAKVENRDGKVIYEAEPESTQVLDPIVDHVMIDMMKGVVTGGTGTGAQLPSWEVAGKTGTTSSHVDAWFVGYTPILSTAVWVGHAEGQIEMPGMTGGSLPASIWQTYMSQVLEGREVVTFPEPDFDALAARLGDRSVTVPDVVRMMEGDALVALGKRKLIGDVQEVNSTATVGTVLWQSPSSGNIAHPGETVYIGVSTGHVPPPPKKDKPKKDEEEPPPEEDTTTDTGKGGGAADG
jgi:penicillin-binding protein 1A